MTGILAEYVIVSTSEDNVLAYDITDEEIKYICIEEKEIRIKRTMDILTFTKRNIMSYSYVPKERG